MSGVPDAESQRWLADLRAEGVRRERCLADLHALLLRAARHETNRRRAALGGAGGPPELDDIAHQAAGDALVAIVAKLDSYRGASRFTTWAYKFVWFEVSNKLRGHLWSDQRAELAEADWERLPDRLAREPDRRAEVRAQLDVLRRAVEEVLTPHQREVFVAVALNEVPIDALAARLDSTRGAVYKTLFDARRKLRAELERAGFPLDPPEVAE